MGRRVWGKRQWGGAGRPEVAGSSVLSISGSVGQGARQVLNAGIDAYFWALQEPLTEGALAERGPAMLGGLCRASRPAAGAPLAGPHTAATSPLECSVGTGDIRFASPVGSVAGQAALGGERKVSVRAKVAFARCRDYTDDVPGGGGACGGRVWAGWSALCGRARRCWSNPTC